MKANRANTLTFENLQNEATNTIGLQCPKCQSLNHMKYGKTKGKQRYRCKKCNTTFHSDNRTPYYRLRKRENTIKYLQAMYDGLSIRKAAKMAGISVKTSFQWRHKFLSSVNQGEILDTGEIIGIKEITLPFSSKGQRRNTKGNPSRSILQISASGQLGITLLSGKSPIKKATSLLSATRKDNKYIYKPTKLVTAAINKSGKLKSSITELKLRNQFLRTLNENSLTLEIWLSRFRGVATKYLSQYWGWFCSLSTVNQTSGDKEFILQCVSKRRIMTMLKT